MGCDRKSRTSLPPPAAILLDIVLDPAHISDMCGRYASFLPSDFLAQLFQARNPPPNFELTWNMAPSRDAPVVRLHAPTGERHLDALKWGLVPYFTRDLKKARKPINARSETIATSGCSAKRSPGAGAWSQPRFITSGGTIRRARRRSPSRVLMAIPSHSPGFGRSKKVGNVRNDGPELIKRYIPAEMPLL